MAKKQIIERIVGAVIVAAFIFILYSIVLDIEPEPELDRRSQIPLQNFVYPAVEGIEQNIEVAKVPKSSGGLFQPSVDATDEQDKRALTEAAFEVMWLVQVGSFSSKDKATEIINQLQKDKLKAYMRPLQASKSTLLHQVLVGPYVKPEQAVSHQIKINKILSLRSKIVRYQP